MDQGLFDKIYTITDERAFTRLAELAKQEGLLVASSSGLALEAALKEAEIAESGTNIVTVLPHSSERHLSTGIYHRDRKSTHLNSSHVAISYADFCYKINK